MTHTFVPGEEVKLRRPIVQHKKTNKKYANSGTVPADLPVELTAIAHDMVFIKYNGEVYSTRLDNLTK